MEATLNYTVKKGDGFITIARYIFSQSKRPYIQSLVSRYDLMKEGATKIEAELKQEYLNFRLEAGQTLKLHADPGHYIPRLGTIANHGSLNHQAKKKSVSTAGYDGYFVIHSTEGNLKDSALEKLKNDKTPASDDL